MLDLGVCEADIGEGKMGVNSGRSRTSWKPLHELKPMRMLVLTASDLELPEEVRTFHLGAKHTYHPRVGKAEGGSSQKRNRRAFLFLRGYRVSLVIASLSVPALLACTRSERTLQHLLSLQSTHPQTPH